MLTDEQINDLAHELCAIAQGRCNIEEVVSVMSSAIEQAVNAAAPAPTATDRELLQQALTALLYYSALHKDAVTGDGIKLIEALHDRLAQEHAAPDVQAAAEKWRYERAYVIGNTEQQHWFTWDIEAAFRAGAEWATQSRLQWIREERDALRTALKEAGATLTFQKIKE